MSFDTTSVPAPTPHDRTKVDSDLRVAVQEHADAAASPLLAKHRRDRESKEIPREAKIAFTIAIGIIAFLIMLPIVEWLTEAPPEAPAAPAAPVATGPAIPTESTAKPRSNASTPSSGGGGNIATPPPPTVIDRVEAPMPGAALTILRGIHGMLHQASHLPPGAVAGNIDPEEDYLPAGTLDGSPAEVLENLQLAQLRVARQPVLGLRIVAEQHSPAAYKFDIEIVGGVANGDEIISRSTIVLVPVSQEVMRITRLDRFESFEKTGLMVTPATFEQTKQALEGGGVVATYPYMIH